jgi:hypothetical protein
MNNITVYNLIILLLVCQLYDFNNVSKQSQHSTSLPHLPKALNRENIRKRTVSLRKDRQKAKIERKKSEKMVDRLSPAVYRLFAIF